MLLIAEFSISSNRVKNVEFLSEGFMVEIPKSLVLADVAIRLLYRSYDTMSPKCSTFHPKIKVKKEPDQSLLVETTEEEKTEKASIYFRKFALSLDMVY